MKIYFSKYNHTQSKSLSSVDNVLYLGCEQKEVDMRILRHCQYILNIQKDAYIVISSPSDDTDIIIIVFFLLNSGHIFIDNETGKNRNCLQIDQVKIKEQEKVALIGFHLITENDYASSFFGKGKHKRLKKIRSTTFFMETVKC